MDKEFHDAFCEVLNRLDALDAKINELMGARHVSHAAPQDDGKPFTDDSLMPFGKHAGKKLRHLPHDYLNWMFEQPEMKNKRLNAWIQEKKQQMRKGRPSQADAQVAQHDEETGDNVPF